MIITDSSGIGPLGPVQEDGGLGAEKTIANTTLDGIKQNLSFLLDEVHKFGITITNLLPFSSRGILINLLFVPIRLMQSMGPDFDTKFKEHLHRDWEMGIPDTYIDLENPMQEGVCKQVIEDYGHYFKFSKNVQKIDLTKPLNYDYPQAIRNIATKLTDMGFKQYEGLFYHVDSGNVFSLFYDKENNEVLFSFSFLGVGGQIPEVGMRLMITRVLSVIGDWLGGIPAAATQAMEIGKMVKEAVQDSDITPVMLGHSHGGGIAQCAALANNLKAVVFNSRPIGAGVRRYIGQNTVAENSKQVTAFSVKSDCLTDNKAINHLGMAFERILGIITPRSVGTGYYLPKLVPGDSFYRSDIEMNHMDYWAAFGKLVELEESRRE